MSYQIYGFLLLDDSLTAYARQHGLDENEQAMVADHITRAVGLWPRARPMLAKHKGRYYGCIAVGSNGPKDHMPVLPRHEIQKLMDYMKTTVEPSWWWHY
ncbi:hypothetical protein BV25DRAFT_1830661 [Artomyces pyxidatus]|uniref:Uncharacterized protein n=1 Tax=Artomyces pyxidatus TaxID=48021 RepID=A0ACB8SPS7_9AGAM|nr:hypothetical protein BV25DRAFT_1830661 [Artomyces pyxidatus]